jgi:hypothetical protein
MHFLAPMLDLQPLHRSKIHNARYNSSIKKSYKEVQTLATYTERKELVMPVTTNYQLLRVASHWVSTI